MLSNPHPHGLGKRTRQAFLWVEYPCSRCETIHRKRYNLIADGQFWRHRNIHPKQSHRGSLVDNNVCIHEFMRGSTNHAIFYDQEIELEDLIKAVKKYTFQHFSIDNLTKIKVEIEN